MVFELVSTRQFFDDFIARHLDFPSFVNMLRLFPSLVRGQPLSRTRSGARSARSSQPSMPT